MRKSPRAHRAHKFNKLACAVRQTCQNVVLRVNEWLQTDLGSAGPSMLEGLEDRKLLAATAFSNGVLTITGDTGAANNLYVTLSTDQKKVWGIANNTGRTVLLSDLKAIV